MGCRKKAVVRLTSVASNTPADQRPDPRIEFGQVQGFGQVIVGSDAQYGDPVIKGITGGNDDYAVIVFILSEVFEQLETAV